MSMEWISVTPNITRNNVSIFQMFLYKFERMQIILFRIISINYKFYTIRINQILVFFFHKTYNHIDFFNSNFMKLLDDTLNQWLTINFQKTLWRLRINGNHPHSKSCRQNNCTLWSFLLKLSYGLYCGTNRIVQITSFHEFLE
mgnify:CR=1 FL=1